MAAIHDTAYPRLKYSLSQKEISRIFTPLDEELNWVRARRLKGNLSLLCLVLLKCFQRLGYFPKAADIPTSVKRHIATFTRLNTTGGITLPRPPKTTQKRIKDSIRRYCEVETFSQEAQSEPLKMFAREMAKTKENIVDIINALLEYLVKESIELPAFSTLVRIAYSARAHANTQYFSSIIQSLTQEATETLESLLTNKNASGLSLWQLVKSEPARPSVRGLQLFTKHVVWVKSLHGQVGILPEIPEEKKAQFILEARAYTSNRMRAIQVTKRRALLALLVSEQLYCCTDFLIDFVIREIRKLHNKARVDLRNFRENLRT